MLVFPQLSDRAVIQYPHRWTHRFRTISADAAWAPLPRYADEGGAERRWRFLLRGLSDSERNAVQELFEAAGGRRERFTFLDPNDNLLAGSEALAGGFWIVDAGLVLTPGQLDPLGGNGAFRIANPTSSPLRIRQVVAAPGYFRFSASVFCRSLVGSTFGVEAGAASTPNATTWGMTENWQRFRMGAQGTTAEESVGFAIVTPALTEIEVYGCQLEACASATSYKKTQGVGGVLANCRFGDDVLEWTTRSVNSHDVLISLIAT